MLVLGRILATLSALILGAHFLRSGDYLLVALAVTLVVAIYIRRRWALVAVYAGMVIGIAEWAHTLSQLVAMRVGMGMPYGRMAAILALVAVVCLAAIVALSSRPVREYYSLIERSHQATPRPLR
jgi:hypothetical protein